MRDGPGTQIGDQAEHALVREDPPDLERRLSDQGRVRGGRGLAHEKRSDLPRPHLEELPVKGEPLRVRRLLDACPVKHRAGSRRLRLGIGDPRPRLRMRELREARELTAAPFRHQMPHLRAQVRKEEEGLRGCPLLPHEEQRQVRGEQENGGGRAHRLGLCQGRDAFAEGAIADLVVVLQKAHEARGRKARARLAPLPAAIRGELPLECETLGEAAREMAKGRLVVLVVAAVLAGQQDVERVMHVVIPLRLVQGALVRIGAGQVSRLIGVVLEDEMDEAVAPGPLRRRARKLGEHVLAGSVRYGVDGVEAQAVEVKLLEPVQCVVHDERPRDLGAGPVEVDGISPGCFALATEERRSIAMQVIAFRTEVVVDDVEEDGQASDVTRIHEGLERFPPSVARVGGEGQDPVVAPAPPTGEVRYGHQLHRRHPERGEMIEPLGNRLESALRSERPHVELVEDEAFRGNAVPLRIGPGIRRRVDDLAGPVDIVRLKARGRVGHEELAVDPERVPRARGRVPRHPLGPAGRITRHRKSPLPVGEPELDAARGRRPEPEARSAVVACLGAERHPVRALYCGPSTQACVLGLRSRSTASERASSG